MTRRSIYLYIRASVHGNVFFVKKETAKAHGKTVVLCGAMMPAAFSRTDAGFNAGNRILDTSQSIMISYYMCMCVCMCMDM